MKQSMGLSGNRPSPSGAAVKPKLINRLCKRIIEKGLNGLGVTINGPNPWDIRVYDESFYTRAVLHGSLGMGEAYMENQWDCDDLPELLFRYLKQNRRSPFATSFYGKAASAASRLMNRQSKSRAGIVAKAHYEISDDMYEQMLGPNLAYSSAYWDLDDPGDTHDAAQTRKYDLTARKFHLTPGDRCLNIGCGWGAWEKHLVRHYGIKNPVGINISSGQIRYAEAHREGLPIEYICCDYRDIRRHIGPDRKFDKILIMGVIEHFGYKNYRTCFDVVHDLLDDDGIYILHTIGDSFSKTRTDIWFDKYIFPNGMLPSAAQLMNAMDGLFVLEDWHCLSSHYAKTNLAWWENFKRYWDNGGKSSLFPGDDEKAALFYRMWKFYCMACHANFRSRNAHLWQIVMTKYGLPEDFPAIR